MDGEITDLPLYAMSKFLCLLHGTLQRDAHIAQRNTTGIGIVVLRPVFRQLTGCHVEHGEGQHIGSAVDLAAGLIDGTDALVVGHQNIDLAGHIHALKAQGFVNAATQMEAQAQIGQTLLVKRNIDLCMRSYFLVNFWAVPVGGSLVFS